METKLVLTLGDNLTADEINRRIDGIQEIIDENRQNLDFHPSHDPRILELNKSVDSD